MTEFKGALAKVRCCQVNETCDPSTMFFLLNKVGAELRLDRYCCKLMGYYFFLMISVFSLAWIVTLWTIAGLLPSPLVAAIITVLPISL